LIDDSIEKTTLNNSLDKPIDSIIFKFDRGGKEKVVCAKYVDPWAKEINASNESNKTTNDSYSLVLVDLMEFIEDRGLNDLLVSKKSDERYLELVSNIFNDYVKKKGNDIKNIDFETSEFAKSPEFNINTETITNSKTKEILENNPELSDLFKIMLGSFRKIRKNTNYILTERIIRDFNKIVEKIKTMTSPVGSESFMTFSDYLKQKELNENIYHTEKYIKIVEEKKEEIEEPKEDGEEIEEEPNDSEENPEEEPEKDPSTGVKIANKKNPYHLNFDSPGKKKVLVYGNSFEPFSYSDEN
jgi:hypothetical protein